MSEEEKKTSDFRYNTGEAEVPWAAVGENYNVEDVMEFIRFMVNGEGEQYEDAMKGVGSSLRELWRHGTPPGKLSLGDKVLELEEKMDSFLGTKNSTFLTNATAGFEIAYKYANLEKGDEVIVPAITFIATMSYPLSVGAKVIFADVDPATLNMDPLDVAKKITGKTKIIVPVHLGGWPVDMEPLMKVARDNDVLVLEDAAHAFGGTYKGKKVGTIGDFGSFSFHEVKNITSFGEGGLITCNLPFADDLKKARFLGLDMEKELKNWLYDVVALQGKFRHFVPGNASATEIQAVGLLRQLDRVQGIIDARRKSAEYLNDRLKEDDAIILQLLDTPDVKSTYHLYLLQIDPER
ncbi:MAG: DegT/DnrJ/EryC1/StrS family aminotransferase, partial [Promethearchaeota archaeon]